MAPRTIDKLGIEVSIQYAQNQQQLDETLTKEARGIPAQTQIDVSTPSFASELEALLHISPDRRVFASFFPPKRFLEQKGRNFSFSLLIPSLGSEEKKEALKEKLTARLRAAKAQKNTDQDEEGNKKPSWQIEREKEDEEKEQKSLLSLFDTISLLDRFLIDINSRRSQYHKG